jgi:hypothetical protein
VENTLAMRSEVHEFGRVLYRSYIEKIGQEVGEWPSQTEYGRKLGQLKQSLQRLAGENLIFDTKKTTETRFE